jgi:hypothetical protein
MTFYEVSAFDPTDLIFNPMWRQGCFMLLPAGEHVRDLTLGGTLLKVSSQAARGESALQFILYII